MQGVYGQNLLEGRIHFLIAVYLIASCFYPVGGEKIKWLPLPVIKYEKIAGNYQLLITNWMN